MDQLGRLARYGNGSEPVAPISRPFRKARAFVRPLGLRSRAHWNEYCKGQLRGKGRKPDDIPTNPWTFYRNDGWISLGDWLGGAVPSQPHYQQENDFSALRRCVFGLGWAGDALRRLLNIPTTPAEKREFIETARQSVGTVLALRKDFAGFFDGAKRAQLDLTNVPAELHEAFRTLMQTEHTMFGMSDSLVIAVPLGDNDEQWMAINGVLDTILAISGMAVAFARRDGIPWRARRWDSNPDWGK